MLNQKVCYVIEDSATQSTRDVINYDVSPLNNITSDYKSISFGIDIQLYYKEKGNIIIYKNKTPILNVTGPVYIVCSEESLSKITVSQDKILMPELKDMFKDRAYITVVNMEV